MKLKGLERAILRAEIAQSDLKNEIHIAQIEEMQQAVVVAMSLAPTEEMVDAIEKEMLANARRAGGGGGAKGVIWRTGQPIADSIGITKTDDMTVTGGVTGAGQMAVEIEFGNRWINEYSYWRRPVWEAWYRLRGRMRDILRKVLNVG